KAKKSVRLMMGMLFGMELELMLAKTINGEEQLHALVDGKKIIITESSVRRDLQLVDEEGIDCLPNSTIFEQLALMGKPKRKDTQIPQSSDPSDNVANEAIHKELGDSLVRAATTASNLEAEQDNGNINKTRSKATPNESSSLGTTSGGGPRCQETIGDTIAQTRLKLDELMALCTTLQNRVFDLEKTKTTQHNEITSLKRRVKKLEKKNRSRTHRLKRLYKVSLIAWVESSDDEESLGEDASKQGRIDAIDANEEIPLVSATGDKVSTASAATTTTATITTIDDITLAQALKEMKSTKTNKKGIVIQELEIYDRAFKRVNTFEYFRTELVEIKEKRKETKLAQEITKKQKVEDDKETTQIKKLMEIIPDEEEVAIDAIPLVVKSPTEVSAAHELERKYAKCLLLDDILLKINADHQLAKRLQAQEKEELAFKRVNTFEDFRIELVEGKEKREETKLAQESTKKQKVEDDEETTQIKKLMEIIPDEEEVAINAIPLVVNHMLKSFNMEDLETLYKLVKAKYESTRPVEDLNLLLWGDLKTMFELHTEDKVWRKEQYGGINKTTKVVEWKL
ncbi:hypothetical protein Tco_0814933, partial [Tanacetum coccineum]